MHSIVRLARAIPGPILPLEVIIMVPKIHRVSGSLMAVNAYLVEGAKGVVVVDGMLTLSDARAVRRALDDIGKPALAGIVTHAHPDHYAGFAEIFRGLDVPIYATPAVR